MFRRSFLASFAAPFSLPANQASADPPVIERAWCGPADRAHGHDALGIGHYPGRVYAVIRDSGRQYEVHLDLADVQLSRADLFGWLTSTLTALRRS